MNNSPRGRRGNTLIELIIYIGLTIVITVGLANVITRIRTAQFTTDVRTEVQQTVRASMQQLTALGGKYGRVSCIPNEDCVAPTEFRLWNESENEENAPEVRTYLRVWVDPVEGSLLAQSFNDGAPSTPYIRLTPASVRVSDFVISKSAEASATPSVGITVTVTDRTATPSSSRDSFSISTAISLRAEGVPLSEICCPAHLQGFCPLSVPICKDGCFQDGQSGIVGLSENLGVSHALALDIAHSRLFVADSTKRVLVYELNEHNVPRTDVPPIVLGGGNDGYQQFGEIRGLAYDSLSDRLFVSDAAKNRVLVYDARILENNEDAKWVLGQPSLTTVTPLSGAQGLRGPRGLAYDQVLRRLYVADTGNFRVVGFNVSTVETGQAATAVFGAPTLDTPSNGTPVNASTMRTPISVAVDSARQRLFVGDSGNYRVTMYDIQSGDTSAEAVIGQDSFTASGFPSSANATSFQPVGIAFDSQGNRLFVTDWARNRVLLFPTENLSGPTPGVPLAATNVLGQPNFTDTTGGTGLADLNAVNDVVIDRSQQRVFVGDSITVTANRIMMYQGGTDPRCGGVNLSSRGPFPPSSSSISSSSSSAPALACSTPVSGSLAGRVNDNITANPPTSPSNVADYIEACGVNDSIFFDLENVPANFDRAVSVTYRVVRALNMGQAGRFSNFSLAVMQNDKTTLLANGPSFAYIGPQDWAQEEVPVLESSVLGTNNRETWNAARLRVQSMTSSSFVRISAIEVDVEYKLQGSEATETITLGINGDAGGESTPTTAWKGVGPPDPSIIAHWPMTPNASIPERIDEMKGSYHGTFKRRIFGAGNSFSDTTAPAIWSTSNASASFPITSTHSLKLTAEEATPYYFVTVPNAPALQALDTTAKFSISLYEARPFADMPARATLMEKIERKDVVGSDPLITTWRGWSLEVASTGAGGSQTGKYRANVYAGAQNPRFSVQTVNAFPVGPTFRHIVMSYDGTDTNVLNRLRIYVDGIQQQVEVVNECGGGGTAPCTLPSLNYTITAPFPPLQMGRYPGLMDDVKIYNRIITPVDVE